MCDTCGCGAEGEVKILISGKSGEFESASGVKASGTVEHRHDHAHSHDHTQPHTHMHTHEETSGHHHSHEHMHAPSSGKRIIDLETDVMRANNLTAMRNRGYFEARDILALNLVSSPGSGKTTLLEQTLKEFAGKKPIYVIEGDQQTTNDAERIQAAGAPVVQINTGRGCHLDSEMIHKAVHGLNPDAGSVLMIENVGNLVCPSLFDLGESLRVVIMSVTEGDDKPLKYPDMFHSSHLCIINKTDLLPYVNFDVQKARQYAMQVNHHLEFIELSATTGEGMQKWYDYLRAKAGAVNPR